MGIASNLLGATASIFSGVAGTPGTSGNSNPFSIPGLPALPSLSSDNSFLQNALSVAPSSTQSPITAATAQSGLMTTVSAFFLRGTIIILGFIFVAVGLSMFKSPAVIQETVGGVARVGGHIRRAARATAEIAS